MSLFSSLPHSFSSKTQSAVAEPIGSELPNELSPTKPLPQEAIGQFFDLVGSPLAIIGFDGSLIRVNPAFCSLLGDLLDEAQSAAKPSWFQFIHPDDLATVQQQWQVLIQHKGAGLIESRINSKGRIPQSEGEAGNCACSVAFCSHRYSHRRVVWQLTPISDQQFVYAVGQDVTIDRPIEAHLPQQTTVQQVNLQANLQPEPQAVEQFTRLPQENPALTEREVLYRTIAQHIPNGAVLLFDRDLRYLLVEGDGLQSAGLDRFSMVGKTLWDVFPAEVCTMIEPYYRAALAGQSRVYEIPFRRQTYEAHTVPIRNEQGEIFAGMVLSQNITDRSRNETLLATQNYILELITTGASLAETLETLAHLIETQSDEAICSIFLLNETDNSLYLAAGPSLPETFWADVANGVPVKPIDTICGTAAYTRQTVIVHDAATERGWAESVALLQKYNLQACWSTPILDSQGQVLGTFALYYRTPRQPDAAEQRLITIASHLAGVAIERQRSGEALKQREDQLRLITETIPQQVWTATPEGQVDYYNQRWCEFTGKTLEQLQHEGWTEIVHPDDFPNISERWAKAVKTGSEYQAEARLLSADGEYHWILGQARPLRNLQGQIVKWYGTNTDITERKQAEAALQESEQRLQVILNQAEQANRIKDEFLAVLSHELRTPLNPILGWSKLLQNRQLSPEKVQQGLETIERNVKLQVQLIDDLLDISRILRGKLALGMAPLNLQEPIASAVETVRLAAEAKAIQIKTQFNTPVQQVFGDASRLQQIMWNLLSNAIKFTPHGGQVTVRLSVASASELTHTLSALELPASFNPADSLVNVPVPAAPAAPAFIEGQLACRIPFVQIEVSDTGKGIHPEFLPYVFEHFRQQDSSTTRQFGGLGLGLAIVRQLVEAHGGTVGVESAGEGQGATFSVYLPLLLTAQPTRSQKFNGQPTLNLQDLRVLLVDDDTDTRTLITYLLEQQQIRVTPVSSAGAALVALKSSTFDVLISDIGMPETDGYTLMHQIRMLPAEQGGNLPAIALTAYASEIDQQQAISAGFQRHLAKPLALEALIQAIAQLARPALAGSALA